MTLSVQTAPTIVADDLPEADIGLMNLSLSQSPPSPRLWAIPRILGAGSQPLLGLGIPSSASMMNGQLKASSSPDLVERPLPDVDGNSLMSNPQRRVSRSKTLSRLPRRMHRTQLSLDGLLMGTDKIAKLRRWILSLVTGEWYSA